MQQQFTVFSTLFTFIIAALLLLSCSNIPHVVAQEQPPAHPVAFDTYHLNFRFLDITKYYWVNNTAGLYRVQSYLPAVRQNVSQYYTKDDVRYNKNIMNVFMQ